MTSLMEHLENEMKDIKFCSENKSEMKFCSEEEKLGPTEGLHFDEKQEIKPELKTNLHNRMETDSEKEDNDDDEDSDFDIKAEQEYDSDSSAERQVKKEKKQTKCNDSQDEISDVDVKEILANSLGNATYKRLEVQNYTCKKVEEEPLENFKDIFKESPLTIEKQRFHQQIFENILGTSGKINLRELQNQYFEKLHQIANINIYTCSLCKYETMNMNNLKCHLLMLHRGKIKSEMFKCDTCGFETHSENHIFKHLKIHMEKPKKGKRSAKQKVVRHKAIIDSDEKYPCKEEECGFEARTADGLHRHLKSHHTDRSQCDLCSFKSKDKETLKEHKDSHRVNNKFQCYECEYRNNCKVTLALHLLNIHKIANEASKRAKICELCSATFSNTPLLIRHYISHKSVTELKESEVHKCPECDYIAKYKTSLNSHMVIHKAPEFICEICGFATKHKKNYKEHLVTHKRLDEIEWFRCDICPYQARNKKLLTKHMKKGDHSGKRLLHVRNRDRIREAEERGEDINALIKKYRIRKINGVAVKCEKIKKPPKNPKRKRGPRKKRLDMENDNVGMDTTIQEVEPGPSHHQTTNMHFFNTLLPHLQS